MSGDKGALPKRKRGTPIQDFLNKKAFRDHRLWTVSDGIAFTQVGEEWMTAEEFESLYPVPISVDFLRAENNPDTTRNFLK